MGVVEEEADETQYWVDLLVEAGLVRDDPVRNLKAEADEIIAMTVSLIRTTRRKR